MDIKSAIESILGNGYKSFITVEKIIYIMMSDYLKSQDKRCTHGEPEWTNKNLGWNFDLVFPDGIDDIEGPIGVEIKYNVNNKSLYRLIRSIQEVQNHKGEKGRKINRIVLIILKDLSKTTMVNLMKICEQELDCELIVWSINILVKYFEHNEPLFFDTFGNLNNILFEETVTQGLNRHPSQDLKENKKYIDRMHAAYTNNDIVLFLGAGVSADAKIAMWNDLISKLFIELLNKTLSVPLTMEQQNTIEKKIASDYTASPLILTRLLKKGLEKEFNETVRKVLYQASIGESELLKTIANLCVPSRKGYGIEAIVNYNFDDLIERQLENLNIKYHPIYSSGDSATPDELGIYHVHGFLPEKSSDYENLSDSLLVFSEEGYHKLMDEPYNWANLRQLNYMINNTCIFIGLSMNDPNMRRLLEIASFQKYEKEDICKHYAFLKQMTFSNKEHSSAINDFEKVNKTLQEEVLKELGVNIVWINDYNELPPLIKQIKNNVV